MDFPYKDTYLTESVIKKRFKNVANYKPLWSSKFYFINNIPSLTPLEKWYVPDWTFKVLACPPDDYFNCNEISDYFTERQRVLAIRHDATENMLEFWEANKDKFKHLSTFDQREEVSKLYKEVGTFRPSVMAVIIDMFKSTKVLDFSSGWGDRLIAALAKKVKLYIGVDPNDTLQEGYKKIESMFNTDTRVKMICAPFETIPSIGQPDSPLEKVDLVFTSPPYFNLEIYNGSKAQSHHYNDDWYSKFLLEALKSAWKCLTIGGKMVININDIKDSKEPYIKKMITDVNKFLDSKYLGVISYGKNMDGKIISPQPMWIWEKLENTNNPVWSKHFINIDKPLVYAGHKRHVELAWMAKYLNNTITIYVHKVNDINKEAFSLGAKYILTNNPRNTVNNLDSDKVYRLPYNLIHPMLTQYRL